MGSQGLKLELCTSDRVGLLTDVSRIFKENNLSITRAEVTTRAGKSINTFYVCDAAGDLVDAKRIESIQQAIGQTILKVNDNSTQSQSKVPPETPSRFLFANLFKSKYLSNFGLVRPYC